MTKRVRLTSHGTLLTCKGVLKRLMVVTGMPKHPKSKGIDHEPSLTFVDWLLAIDLDPLNTRTGNRDA